MKITVFGTGYVGLVTGTCLASVGHHVYCVDLDEVKIDKLKQGIVTIYEPQLETLVQENLNEGRLTFTTDSKSAVLHAEVIFIAVGTPPLPDGTADLRQVQQVAEQIANHIQDYTIVVNKSTVPVGTVDMVRTLMSQVLVRDGRGEIHFDVCSNPEFLKEGAAIEDFRRPDRIVIGCQSERVKTAMRSVYAGFSRNHEKLIFMDPRSAELTKYAANAMLAAKISFINEISNIAEKVGADIENVRQGIGSDSRIGYDFIYAGCGYGGSCFPKDVKALSQIAAQHQCNSRLLDAVDEVNEQQKAHLLNHIDAHFGQDLSDKRIAVWGLSYKPQTDDVREASSQVLIKGLLARGAKVFAYDPHAIDEFKRSYGHCLAIDYCESMMEPLNQADALLVCTEWRQFRSPDFIQMLELMKQPVIFDGRNIYDPQEIAHSGFTYYGIGRGASVKNALL